MKIEDKYIRYSLRVIAIALACFVVIKVLNYFFLSIPWDYFFPQLFE